MIAGCRTLSRAVWLTACSAALLAGCGGDRPKLAGADAAPLVALAHRVPRDAPCAQARDIRTLQRRATALVNARRVPVELQEPLMSGVAALAEQAPVCLPKVPASAPTPPASPSSPSPPAPGGKRSSARKHGHDHGHGRGRAREGKAQEVSAYTLDREVGRGGMAVVYAGHQHELDRPVALKVLADHLAGNREFRDRFLREARIAARLHHPHLVRTFDVTELDGRPCIVMELLPGGTLEGGSLTREEGAQVADALAYAHRHGVVHRDLKPGNLLRGPGGEVKIADFGIARAAEETMLTEAGTVLGTLRYLAPEQAEGRTVGPEADVYSLGVVLRELLVEPDPALVERCLAEAPGERPTAAEVAAQLGAAPTVVRRPRNGVRHLKVSDTRPWVLAAAALAAIAAAVAVAVTQRDSKPARVEPVPHATTPAQQARNLEAWLRKYSG